MKTFVCQLQEPVTISALNAHELLYFRISLTVAFYDLDVVRCLDPLWDNPELLPLHDFALVSFQGQRIPCVLALLAAKSPVFRAMLTNPQSREVSNGELRLRYGSLTLHTFWRFVMTGEIDSEPCKDKVGFLDDDSEDTEAKLLKNLYILAGRFDVKDMRAAVEFALFTQACWDGRDLEEQLETHLEICKIAQDLNNQRLLNSLAELLAELVAKIDSPRTLLRVFKFLLSMKNDLHLLSALDYLTELQIKKELVLPTFGKLARLLDGRDDKIFLVKMVKLCKYWESEFSQPEEKAKCLEMIFSKLSPKSVRLMKEALKESK